MKHSAKLSTSFGFFRLPRLCGIVCTAILSFVLLLSLSFSASAEDHLSSAEKADITGPAENISVEMSSAIWPCFPNHFFFDDSSLSDVFAFADYINVEVTDGAEFLSESIWSSLCEAIYEKTHPPTGSELLNIGKINAFEPATAQVAMEDFFSFSVSIEIWQVIAKELEASQRFIETYIVTSNTVIFTYKHAALCSLNIELRERVPMLCNYLELQEMMASSWVDYNAFVKAHEADIPSAGMREYYTTLTSQAHQNFSLLSPWE
ncbi:MAG: hypothetical protein ABJ364_08580 [Lentilitoribacter sp.]